MEREKKKVLVRRIIGLIFAGLLIILEVLLCTLKPKIVDHEGFIVDYYPSINSTTCEIKLTFDMPVYDADVTIAFYDENGNLLDTVTEWFYGGNGNGKTLTELFVSIDGEVESYEIVSYSSQFVLMPGLWVVPISLFVLLILLLAFGSKCKVYYYNGKRIVVFSGYFHNHIKVDGQIYDEYTTFTSFTPITLSCDVGEKIEARISPSGFITLKVNGILQKPISFFEKELKNAGNSGSADN